MRIETVVEELAELQAQGVVDSYAIGGAVAATFYLEPIATIDVDVFVVLQVSANQVIIDPSPIFKFLTSHGHKVEGEYVVIHGWPVQFLASNGSLVDEAIRSARTFQVGNFQTRVFTPEHLAAIALEVGRPKDKARLLLFLEQGAIDMDTFHTILNRHGLLPRWKEFSDTMLGETS